MNQSIDLEAAQAAFFASGGSIIVLDGFQYAPHRPHRDLEQVRATQPKPPSQKALKRQKQLAELRDAGLNRAQAKAKLGISDRKFCRVIHLFGVEYPKVEGKRCDGPV